MKKLFIPSLALLAALSFSFINKQTHITLMRCSASSEERNQLLGQAIAALNSSGFTFTGYQIGNKPGTYCFEIYFNAE